MTYEEVLVQGYLRSAYKNMRGQQCRSDLHVDLNLRASDKQINTETRWITHGAELTGHYVDTTMATGVQDVSLLSYLNNLACITNMGGGTRCSHILSATTISSLPPPHSQPHALYGPISQSHTPQIRGTTFPITCYSFAGTCGLFSSYHIPQTQHGLPSLTLDIMFKDL